MRRRILIAEDEPIIARSIAFGLRREGFDTEIASTGSAAVEAARARPPDLVVLDVVLPGELNGYDVCRELRTIGGMPIVMLSARGTEMDRVLGLERGADDYMTKPFSMAELIARVHARLRRIELDRTPDAAARFVGSLRIDLLKREVTLDGEPIHLTVSEFNVLDLLSERPGEVVSRKQIMSRLWSSSFDGDTRTCDAHVRRLRRKIERDPSSPARVVTVRGVGYKLVG